VKQLPRGIAEPEEGLAIVPFEVVTIRGHAQASVFAQRMGRSGHRHRSRRRGRHEPATIQAKASQACPYPIPCHCRIASTGQNSIKTLSVRLSRMIHSVSSSRNAASATLAHAGTRAAARKPAIIQPMSAAELTMESPL